MSEHVWAQDHVASYVAGGLATADRARMQDHVAMCAECRAALSELESLDRGLRGLFAGVQPPVTLEERTIRSLRTVSVVRRRAWSWPMKGMMIAAGVMLLVGVGALLSREQLAFPDQAIAINHLLELPALAWKESAPAQLADGDPDMFERKGAEPANAAGGDAKYSVEFEKAERAKSFDESRQSGPVSGEDAGKNKLTPYFSLPDSRFGATDQFSPSAHLLKAREMKLKANRNLEAPGVISGISPVLPEPAKVGNVYIVGNEITKGAVIRRAQDGGEKWLRYPAVTVADPAAVEAEKLRLKIMDGVHPNGELRAVAGPVTTYQATTPTDTPMPGRPEPKAADSKAEPTPTLRYIPPPAVPAPAMASPPPASESLGAAKGPPSEQPTTGSRSGGGGGGRSGSPREPATESGIVDGRDKAEKGDFFRPDDTLKLNQSGDGATKGVREESLKRQLGLKAGDGEGKGGESLKEQLDDSSKDRKKTEEVAQEKRPAEQPPSTKLGADEPARPQAPKTSANPMRKIIIRSGDIEFEVDSFDGAVASVLRIIGKTKEGFIATVNSEKLANGKMRGSVVVRMPPEELDAFVLELRQTLAKTGELKGQRIGSQDVTKQYTDLESELKAARTMEERLLNLMKDGKGAIKDLLQVEKDLGTYRTKIEKIEGELRYYSNLVSLSTLSITLQEKEIRAAASYTETEQVKAGVEVEDVEKAYLETQAAIREFKGRIGRAEMKQHAAGQFNAILVFEIAPEQSGPMRDRLRQLGNMVRLDIDRVQKVENGGEPTKDGKIRRGDSEFTVSLYNLANVAPRETTTLTLVASDVPAAYRKLREIVGKLKTTVRNAQLQEQDKQNVTAQLDFDVRRTDEPSLQGALETTGEVLNRRVDRRADAENVTDAKMMFLVHLISTNAIEPRETIRRTIAVTDVPAAYNRLQQAVGAKEAHGRVRSANLQEVDRQNNSATVEFDVDRVDELGMEKALGELGETLTKRVDRKVGDNVTDKKVLYQVNLIAETSIEPREVTEAALAVTDVPATYRKLRDLVEGAKGLIRNATLQETDRQNITAQLEVIVRRGDEVALLAAINDAGEVITRSTKRNPDGEKVTNTKVGFKLEIRSAGTITPRKKIALIVEVENVRETLTRLADKVTKAGGRVIDGPRVLDHKNGRVTGQAKFDVPLVAADGIAAELRSANKSRYPSEDVSEDTSAPEGRLAVAQITVTLNNAEQIVPRDEGLDAQLRNGLSISLRGLLVSVSWLISAIVFLGPWALVIWIIIRVARRNRIATEPVVETPPTAPQKPV